MVRAVKAVCMRDRAGVGSGLRVGSTSTQRWVRVSDYVRASRVSGPHFGAPDEHMLSPVVARMRLLMMTCVALLMPVWYRRRRGVLGRSQCLYYRSARRHSHAACTLPLGRREQEDAAATALLPRLLRPPRSDCVAFQALPPPRLCMNCFVASTCVLL